MFVYAKRAPLIYDSKGHTTVREASYARGKYVCADCAARSFTPLKAKEDRAVVCASMTEADSQLDGWVEAQKDGKSKA